MSHMILTWPPWGRVERVHSTKTLSASYSRIWFPLSWWPVSATNENLKQMLMMRGEGRSWCLRWSPKGSFSVWIGSLALPRLRFWAPMQRLFPTAQILTRISMLQTRPNSQGREKINITRPNSLVMQWWEERVGRE